MTKIIGTLKIQDKYAENIFIHKIKNYEVRKASKGLITGYYEYTKITKNNPESVFNDIVFKFGSAHLTPVAINPIITSNGTELENTKIFFIDNKGIACELDYETYLFTKENYIDKNIDFVICKITDRNYYG